MSTECNGTLDYLDLETIKRTIHDEVKMKKHTLKLD